MLNPAKLLKLKGAWDTFTKNHPKFPLFLNAVSKSGIPEDTIIEIKITNPSGQTFSSNVKITKSDRELFDSLSDILH